jgi:hypothetical protein
MVYWFTQLKDLIQYLGLLRDYFLINFNNTNLVLKCLRLARKSPRFLQKSFVKTNERVNVDSEQKIRFLVKRVSLFSEHRLQEVA